MQDRNLFESYLRRHSWSKADLWLENELALMRRIVKRQRALIHTFGVTMSLVLAFFTWVVLFPSADEKELEAFPLTTILHNLFVKLCDTVPGGKAAVIIGLIIIPFIITGAVALAFLFNRPKEIPEETAKKSSPNKVQTQIKNLSKQNDKYQNGYITLLLYLFFAGIFTGGVMVFSAVPGGLNPFEYVFVGIICDVVYGLVFGAVSFILYSIQDSKGVPSYPTYKWDGMVEDAKEDKKGGTARSSTRSSYRIKETEYYKEKYDEYYAMYMGQTPSSPTDNDVSRLVKDTEEDLSGMGFGDY